MYLPRVSLDLFTRNFSLRLSFMSVMKTNGPGKDCVGDQDTKEDYRDGDQDAQEEGEQPDADLVCRPLLALLPLHGQDGLVQVHLQETGGRRGS